MGSNQRAVVGRVTGRVQGVSYRASFRREAQSNGLAGWVRNVGDGSVEFMVQGDPQPVESVVEWAREGPPFARVANVAVQDVVPDPDLQGFEIRY